jgi:hypothetical protein
LRLTDEQIELYSRQIILREVGGVGQTALRAARVMVHGTGAAPEACVSYLVGAGIGTIDLADARATGDATVLPLPDPARRTPDAVIVAAPRASDADVALTHDGDHDENGPDVALDLDVARTRAAKLAASEVTPAVATRLGAMVLRADSLGGLHLLLLPRDRGCPSCTSSQLDDGIATVPVTAGAIASASAGALAALVCCRWLLGIGGDDTARTLVLSPGSAIWVDGPPPTRRACPRGCPPPAHPV